MTTRLQEDGNFEFIGTFEENVVVFYDLSANTLIFREEQNGTQVDRFSIVMSGTDPEFHIPSNTTPSTDYLRLGAHTGTAAVIDLVGGATLNIQIDGTTEVALTASDLNLQANTLSNIGNAGNDWGANDLLLVSSNGGSVNQIRVGNDSNTAGSEARLRVDVGGTSAGDCEISMAITGGEGITLGMDTSDSGNFKLSDGVTLGSNDRLRIVVATGVMSVDGDAGGSDDPVGLFDSYDDALELEKFAYSHPAAARWGISEEQREANRLDLVEMGVCEWAEQDKGPDHLMFRIQPMFRLVAGGIYQTRRMLDQMVETFTAEIAALKQQLALKGSE
jgi:hypothetical protein